MSNYNEGIQKKAQMSEVIKLPAFVPSCFTGNLPFCISQHV